MFCVLCGAKAPKQWRWRKTADLRAYSRRYCERGPFVWRTLMNYEEPECVCCLGCVFQMRKRAARGRAVVPHMWPMDAYLLWLLRMDRPPDKRQMKRFGAIDSVYMGLDPLRHIRTEQQWLDYNLDTSYFHTAAAAARFRRLSI